jgi:hypothetical protein
VYLSDAEHAELDRMAQVPPEGFAARSVKDRARKDRLTVDVLSDRVEELELRVFWLEEFLAAADVMLRDRDREIEHLGVVVRYREWERDQCR